MPNRLQWADNLTEVSVVDAGANLKGRFPIVKRKSMDYKELFEAALETPVDGEADVAKRFDGDDDKASAVALYRFADAVGLAKMFEQQEQPKEEPVEEPVAKAEETQKEPSEMNEDIAKRFESLQKQLDDKDAELSAVKDELQKSKDAADLAEWTAKAKENLQYVPGDLAEVAKSLHETAKLNPELAEAQYKRFCDMSDKLSKSEAFTAIGTSGASATPVDEAIAKRAKENESAGMSKLEALKKAAIDAEKSR